MGMIVIGVGTTQLGSMRTAPNGDVVSVTPAVWKPDSKGGSVAIWPLNPETMEQTARRRFSGIGRPPNTWPECWK